MAGSLSSFPLPLKDNIGFASKIESWEDCKRWHDKTKPGQFIFRGLPSSKYDPEPTFDRAYRNNKSIATGIPEWRYEAVMLLNFQRIAHQYVDASNIPQENDILEWLSLFRHYGAPSRLLDFSYSFYIAAYFAIEGADIDNKNDPAIVWAIDQQWLSWEAYNLLEKEKSLLKSKQIKSSVFQDPKLFAEIVMNPQYQKDFAIFINPFKYNQRIHLQQGVFLCPCNIEHTFEQNLVGIPGIDSNKVFRIMLKKNQKRDIIKDLNQMNISCETLYGDLEGVALSFNDFFCLDYRLSTNEELLYRVIRPDQTKI